MAMKNILLLLFSSLFVLLLIELGLRLTWSNPYAQSGTDKMLRIKIQHKNLRQTFNRKFIDPENPKVLFRTNQRGYIEPASRFADPDFTIAFLGGSTTETSAVDEEKRFPYLVSKLIEKEGLRVNSLNAARSGGTVHDSLNILLNHVIVDRPDVVVLMHAANDIGVLKSDDDYSTRMGQSVSVANIAKFGFQIGSSKSSFVGLLRKAVTFSGFYANDGADYSTHIDVIEPYRSRLKIFVGICRAFGITPVLMTQPVAGSIKNKLSPDWIDLDAQDRFNDTIREIGDSTNTTVIDLEAYIAKIVMDGDKLTEIFYDGIHVTDHGSSLYAAHITKKITELYKRDNPIYFDDSLFVQ